MDSFLKCLVFLLISVVTIVGCNKNNGGGDEIVSPNIENPESSSVIVNNNEPEDDTISQINENQDDQSAIVDNEDDEINSQTINGTILAESLIGEWELIKFAYMANDDKILDVAAISKGSLTIPYASTPIENYLDDRWCLSHTNQVWFVCSLAEDSIELQQKGTTYIYPPQEEIEIQIALSNAYRIAIEDDELMIYFKGDKNKNLLILKKR